MSSVQHEIAYWLGLTNGSGPVYLFHSGFGGELVYLSVFGMVYRRLNCHITGCWRIGVHHVEGTPFMTCKSHHPAVPEKVTVEHVHRRHREWRAGGSLGSHPAVREDE